MTGPRTLDLPDGVARFDLVRAALAGRSPAVFLDYDGTLTPIASTPGAAVLPDATRASILRLRSLVPVAIVSGRDRADVAAMIGVDGLVIAGSHGFDLAGPDWAHTHPEGHAAVPALAAAADRLEGTLADVPGLLVERKAYAVAVHVRNVDPAHHGRVLQAVQDTAASDTRLRHTGGKAIEELRPAVPWDKGRAVEYLLARLDLDPTRFAPVYVGDDETDEDALAAVAGTGVGVVVAVEDRPTAASFRLADAASVAAFLDRLADHVAAS